MKKGFTLLELIVVIIIIGILATLGISQYSSIIEKSRAAEARNILGTIRTNASAIYMNNNNSCLNCTDGNLGITTDFPGPGPGGCNTSHYFYYGVVGGGAASGVTIRATRCTAGCKGGAYSGAGGTVVLTADFTAGGSGDTWTTSGLY